MTDSGSEFYVRGMTQIQYSTQSVVHGDRGRPPWSFTLSALINLSVEPPVCVESHKGGLNKNSVSVSESGRSMTVTVTVDVP
jgi:hypothetical protein